MKDITKKIVNNKVKEIKELVDKGELENSDRIQDYCVNGNGYLFDEQDFLFLLEENGERGLSDIYASSMVIGEYISLNSLLNDLINDILVEEIEKKLKKDDYYYIEEWV